MIHATSRKAAAELREKIASLLDSPEAATVDREVLADELYSVAKLLADQPRLRRSLGDASTDASSRADLGRSLLTGKISARAVEITAQAIELRWSSPWDLTDSLEIAGDEALLSSAERSGQLDEVEDELFRFERILERSGELSTALDEVIVPVPARIALLQSLLGGKVNPITMSLLTHALSSQRRRRLQTAIQDVLDASATRRERSIARVITARELTPAQSDRLGALLSQMYGRQMTIRAAVDAKVQGGLVVRVGDEVIDATISTRLAAARAAFAN